MGKRFLTERMKEWFWHDGTKTVWCHQCKGRRLSKMLVQRNEYRDAMDGGFSYKVFTACEEKGHFQHQGWTKPLYIEHDDTPIDERTFAEQEAETQFNIKEAEAAMERNTSGASRNIF